MNESLNSDCLHQKINFYNINNTNDINTNATVLVTRESVTIIPSNGKHTVGSSKVKLKNLVDYAWEQRFYTGQILAIHMSGRYIAYGIQGKDSGVIRIINLETTERALIKGIEGMAQDIAFAFIKSQVLLACVDSIGDVYIYLIEENQLKSLTFSLILHIKQDSHELKDNISRIVWCPYVPDDDHNIEDDDYSKLIVTCGNKAHLWNVNLIHDQHGITPVSPNTVSEGFLEIEIDKYVIVDLAFSPDGSTVALACSDGGVRFFQVDVQEGQSPMCIHDWRPHNGKPVSCLYFLDNHLDSDCHFWKFAITGVEGNNEIKIWTCETWSCLQTLKYAPCDDNSSSKLKVAIDVTANYILLSDMQRRLLHVLQLKKNAEETGVRIYLISEFLLPLPILGFGIVSIQSDCCPNDERRELLDVENQDETRTTIKLYLVQPRALQECIIVYDANENISKYLSADYENDIHADSSTILNGLNIEQDIAEHENNLLLPNNFSSATNTILIGQNSSDKYLPVSAIEDDTILQPRHINLTDEFHPAEVRISCNEVTRRSLERDNISLHISNENENGCGAVDSHVDDGGIVGDGKSYYSTGSSPSREVQHILFSSEVVDESCCNIQTKDDETDIPITVWPKIPITEPKNLCQDLTEIVRMLRNENNVDDKNNEEYHKRGAELQAIYAKIDVLEERMNQLNENMKNQQQDVKQSLNKLYQCLITNKEEAKKNQRNVNNEERCMSDRIVSAITQNVNSMISNEVEYIIKEEINGNVLPSLKNTMDTFGQQLHVKMTQHMSNAEQNMKEYIMKTVHKKSVTDAIANSLASVLPPVISNSFAEVFCKIILPKFEKSCHEMFDQVNNLFVDGTRDFVSVLQNHTHSYEEKQCNILQSKIDEFFIKLNETTENTNFDAVKSIEPDIINSIKSMFDEQKLQIETYLLNVNKIPVTNLVNVVQKQQEHIDYLISQGKIDIAIEQVLSASDLKLLVCLCEKLDPDIIFSEPCAIQQHILLSFIQQLSVDLNMHTDLKHRFIEGAVMCLDKKHPVCEKNFPKILPAVRTRILQYITANPNNKNTRNMKILLMAVDSLLAEKNDSNFLS